MQNLKLTREFSAAHTWYKNRTRVAFSKLRMGWRSGSPISQCWNRRKLLMICNPKKNGKMLTQLLVKMDKCKLTFSFWFSNDLQNILRPAYHARACSLMDIIIMQSSNTKLIISEEKKAIMNIVTVWKCWSSLLKTHTKVTTCTVYLTVSMKVTIIRSANQLNETFLSKRRWRSLLSCLWCQTDSETMFLFWCLWRHTDSKIMSTKTALNEQHSVWAISIYNLNDVTKTVSEMTLMTVIGTPAQNYTNGTYYHTVTIHYL